MFGTWFTRNVFLCSVKFLQKYTQCPIKYSLVLFITEAICVPCEVWAENTKYKNKGKAVPLLAWSGPEGSRKLRFLDFMTTAQDGGKVVSLTHRPPLPPGNTPGTHFCQRLIRPQGHSVTGRIMSLRSSNDTIEKQTRDLPACSVVLYTLRHRAPRVCKI
jgi:hypothetical protein